jgi:hypothetical protein
MRLGVTGDCGRPVHWEIAVPRGDTENGSPSEPGPGSGFGASLKRCRVYAVVIARIHDRRPSIAAARCDTREDTYEGYDL